MSSARILHKAILQAAILQLVLSLCGFSARAEQVHDSASPPRQGDGEAPKPRSFADPLPPPLSAFEKDRRQNPNIDLFARMVEARFRPEELTTIWVYHDDFQSPAAAQSLINKLEALRPAIHALSRFGTIGLTGSPGVTSLIAKTPNSAVFRPSIWLSYRMSLAESLARLSDLYLKLTCNEWFRRNANVNVNYRPEMSQAETRQLSQTIFSKLARLRQSPLAGRLRIEGFPSNQAPDRRNSGPAVIRLRANDPPSELERQLTLLESTPSSFR